MGERKCAFDGCNALEFRTTEYCLRHKNGINQERALKSTKTKTTLTDESSSSNWRSVLMIFYIIVPFILFLNIITHEEPPGAIAPTGLCNIPCFVCSLFPLFLMGIMPWVKNTEITTARDI